MNHMSLLHENHLDDDTTPFDLDADNFHQAMDSWFFENDIGFADHDQSVDLGASPPVPTPDQLNGTVPLFQLQPTPNFIPPSESELVAALRMSRKKLFPAGPDRPASSAHDVMAGLSSPVNGEWVAPTNPTVEYASPQQGVPLPFRPQPGAALSTPGHHLDPLTELSSDSLTPPMTPPSANQAQIAPIDLNFNPTPIQTADQGANPMATPHRPAPAKLLKTPPNYGISMLGRPNSDLIRDSAKPNADDYSAHALIYRVAVSPMGRQTDFTFTAHYRILYDCIHAELIKELNHRLKNGLELETKPLMRELDATHADKDLAPYIAFAHIGKQREIDWMFCLEHLDLMKTLDLNDPDIELGALDALVKKTGRWIFEAWQRYHPGEERAAR